MTDDVDIIDKLNRVGWSNSIGYSIDVSKEAVAEIERLREENQKLKPVKDENMTDIAEKLKSSTQWWHADCDMKMEAAHEIERLREENRKLKERITELGWIASPERMGQ